MSGTSRVGAVCTEGRILCTRPDFGLGLLDLDASQRTPCFDGLAAWAVLRSAFGGLVRPWPTLLFESVAAELLVGTEVPAGMAAGAAAPCALCADLLSLDFLARSSSSGSRHVNVLQYSSPSGSGRGPDQEGSFFATSGGFSFFLNSSALSSSSSPMEDTSSESLKLVHD